MDGERQLGSEYLLQRPLGEGASGQVWLGHDRAGHDRAIKLLRHDLASDGSVVQRFVQERSVLGSIHHPNVVQVHDLVVEGSTLAIVMDYVDGQDLASLLAERGTLPPEEVVRIGQQVAAALHAAHHQGVVHRDVKPANVLIERATGSARLGDFGIAKIVDAAQRRTMLLGTPLYMAPEIIEGHDPTPAADVYSLGLTLYELLCGVPAFAGRASSAALLRAHVSEDPGRPEGIPDRLWALIARMVAKDPAARPTAGGTADALRAAESECHGVPAAPPLTVPPPTVLVAGAAAAVAALGDDVTRLSLPPTTAVPHATPTGMAATSLGMPYGAVSAPGVGPAASLPPGASYLPAASYPPGGPGASYPPGGYGAYQGAYAVGYPAGYAAPDEPKRGKAPLVAALVVGILALGGAGAFLGTRLNSEPAAASASTPAAAASPSMRGAATSTATDAPAQVAATTSVPAAAQTSVPAPPVPTTVVAPPPAPATSVAQVQAPTQAEADATVMGYHRALNSGNLGSADMARYFTSTVNWYSSTLTRGELYSKLSALDMVKYRQTYESPRYTSYVGPTTYQGQPAARIAYYVAYHKPGDSGTVKVTYVVVRESDGQCRIASVSEEPA